jgi:hypothetical protein
VRKNLRAPHRRCAHKAQTGSGRVALHFFSHKTRFDVDTTWTIHTSTTTDILTVTKNHSSSSSSSSSTSSLQNYSNEGLHPFEHFSFCAFLVALTCVSVAPAASSVPAARVPANKPIVPDNTTKTPDGDSYLRAQGMVDIQLDMFQFQKKLYAVMQTESAKMRIHIVQTGHSEKMDSLFRYKNATVHCSEYSNSCFQVDIVNCAKDDYKFYFYYNTLV